MFQIETAADLIPLVLSVLIPVLTAYVARTDATRYIVPMVASVALTVATALVDGGRAFDVSLIGFAVETFLVQFGAYRGGWRLAKINDRATATT